MTSGWIQDFPEKGASTSGGTNLLFGHFFLKTAWKWRNFGRRGRIRGASPLDPPLMTLNGPHYVMPVNFYESHWMCVFMQLRLLCDYFTTDKKVLLRERKRHTARRVASARYAALSPDERGGCVYISSPGLGGVPHPVIFFPSSPGWGYPLS